MADYDYKDIGRIAFTEDDIAVALDGLSEDDRYKTGARLSVQMVNGTAVQLFGRLAVTIAGRIKTDYDGFVIVVPKNDAELREAALYSLRYHDRHGVLRDARALDSGVTPKNLEP